jgi:hypothetical protein
MADHFIEATMLDNEDRPHPVLISLRAVAYIKPIQHGCMVYFSGLEDDFLQVRESYDDIISAMGWTRAKP